MTATGKNQVLYAGAIGVITLLGAILRLWGLSADQLTGDEISSVISALNYVEGGSLGPTMWNHPNLRNLLLAGTLVSGLHGLWSVKAASLLLGILTVPVLFLATRELTGSTAAALAAGLLLAVDPLHIDFSRQAVHEVYMAFFSLSGVWLSLLFLRRGSVAALIAAGLCFGLGISSKWEPVFPLVVMAGYLFLKAVVAPDMPVRERTARAVLLAGSLGILPVVVYLLTYLPWFLSGKGLDDWLLLQQEMFKETVTHSGYNAYNFTISHSAAEWFIKPVEFVDVIFGLGGVKILVGISNPLVWCLVLPAAIYFVWSGLRQGRRYTVLSAVLFIISYLPFLVTSRPIWAHSAFTTLCFGLAMLASCLISLARISAAMKRTAGCYLLAVLLAAMPLYLLAVGKGEDYKLLHSVIERYRPVHER